MASIVLQHVLDPVASATICFTSDNFEDFVNFMNTVSTSCSSVLLSASAFAFNFPDRY